MLGLDIGIFARNEGEVFVFIEYPMQGRNGKVSMQLAQVSGACISHAYGVRTRSNVKVYQVESATWKKRVIGKGNATKTEVQAWLYTYWRQAYDLSLKKNEKPDEDKCDSAAICMYGIDVLRNRMAPKPRKLLKRKR